MSRNTTKKILPFVLTVAGAVGLGSENSVKAESVPGSNIDFTAIMVKRAVEAYPPMSPETLPDTFKAPAKMVEQSLVAENPMHAEDKRYQGSGVVTGEVKGKVVKIGFGPAGLPEVVVRLPKAVQATSENLKPKPPTEQSFGVEHSAVDSVSDGAGTEKGFPVKISYVGVEVLFGPDYKELSPEFAWVADFAKKGLITGFSFVETRPGSVFNNNSIVYKRSAGSPVYPKAEFGFANGAPFGSAGVEWNIKQTLPISRVFNAVTLTYFHKLYGTTPEHQVVFFWDTEALKMFGLDVDTQGFIRFRPGKPGKYGQPQVTVGAKWLPKGVRMLFQGDVAGDHAAQKTRIGFSAGVKIYPQETKWYRKIADTFRGTKN